MPPEPYIPIDDWAKEKHPKFLENVQAHIDVLCDEMTPDERYGIVRGIMQYARQEFEG